jgi:uncharacterized protein (TIGR02246 family)
MKADPKTEAAVMDIVKQSFQAFAKRDIDVLLAFFAPDPDVVLIGTGRDEKCIGLTQAKAILERAFTQFRDASVEFGWHSVSAAGSVALVAADVILHIKTSEREMSEQLRLTVALEQRRNNWLIIQWHDSLPAAGQKDGQAFAT